MTDPLAPLLADLCVDRPSLPLLPAPFLEAAAARVAETPAQEAAILLALSRLRPGPASDAEALRDYFSAREAREDEPWRRAARRAQVQIDAANRAYEREGAFEQLFGEFLAKARAGLFSETEALCLGYLLCPAASAEAARFRLAFLLVNVPASARIAVHNWTVAGEMAEARRDANGALIAALPWPLFPDRGGFEALNARLLAQSPSGGGPRHQQPPNGIFAQRPGLFEHPSGAGALPIYGPAGEQTAALETTPLEQALADIRAEVAAIRSWRGRGRGRGWQGAPGQRGGNQGPKNGQATGQ